MTQSVWTLNDIHLGPGSSRLSDVNLEIGSGRTAILGCSGAGKSSLLSLLASFEKPASGTIAFNPTAAADQIPLFWSPQDHGLWPHLTASQHIEHVLPDLRKTNRSTREWLDVVELNHLADVRPDRMSQGERSRLSLVRTLASEAWAMLFDEPLVHVGAAHAADCWRLIEKTQKQLGSTIVYSTHEPNSVLRSADDVICLDAGRVVYNGPVPTLHFNPPDQATAGLLGPFNWFSPDDESVPASLRQNWPQCVRPFELILRAAPDGDFQLKGTSQVGPLLEVSLRSRAEGHPIELITTAGPPVPTTGEAVHVEFRPSDGRPVT